MAKSVRQSNIEVLRIIAMIFIVIGHIVFHGTHNSIVGSTIFKTITAYLLSRISVVFQDGYLENQIAMVIQRLI